MTREQKYVEQLKQLGIYHELFDPEIHQLAILERDLQRLTKRWKDEGCPTVAYDCKGSPTSDKTFDAISSLRREILAHRDALGLTPKSLRRIKGELTGGGSSKATPDREPTVLDLVLARQQRRA